MKKRLTIKLLQIIVSLIIRVIICLVFAPVLMYTLNLVLKSGYWGAVGILLSALVVYTILTIKITFRE